MRDESGLLNEHTRPCECGGNLHGSTNFLSNTREPDSRSNKRQCDWRTEAPERKMSVRQSLKSLSERKQIIGGKEDSRGR